MRAHGLGLLTTLGAGLLAASCSFSRFDDLKGDAKAKVLDSPFGGGDYGEVLVTTRPATGEPRLLVAARGQARDLAFYTFTPAGGADLLKLRGGGMNLTDTARLIDGPIGDVAAAPNGDMGALVGSAASANRTLYFLDFDANGAPRGRALSSPAQFTPGFGENSLAMGDFFKNAPAAPTDGETDAVVAGIRELYLYPQQGLGGSVARCRLPGADLQKGRLAGADFIGGNDLSELAMGQQRAGVPGSVSFFTVADFTQLEFQGISNSTQEATRMCTAVGTVIPAPGGEASFGATVVAGNVIGGPEIDLVVGAPEQNVIYIFPGSAAGPLVAGSKKIDISPAVGKFGTAIAILDLDGDGKNELAIGEPRFVPPGGDTEAGRVHLYALKSDGDFQALGVLNAHEFSSEHFGRGLAALKFSAGGKTVDQLVVGEQEQVVIYFDTNLRFSGGGLTLSDADERVR